MRKVIITTILIIFLIGLASAENSYSKEKDGIGFTDEVNVNDFTITKDKNQIKIKSDKHYETSVKIKYSDLQDLEGFSGTINIIHIDDSGKNDWSKTITPDSENGYIYLDLEFSEIVITGGASPVANWNFETWTAGDTSPPDSWTLSTWGFPGEGTIEKITSPYITDYAAKVTATQAADTYISQVINLTDYRGKTVTVGAYIYTTHPQTWIWITGLSGDQGQYRTSYSPTNDWGWIETSFTVPMDAGDVSILVHMLSPSIGAYYGVDCICFYENANITATETIDNPYVYMNVSDYSPTINITSGTVTLEYPTFDGDNHPNYNITEVLFNGADKTNTSFIHGNNIVIGDVTALTTSNYTINTTVNYNPCPTLISPTNGSTIEREFPPLYDDVTFTWENTGTTCQIQVSEDTAFSNVVYSGETTAATRTISLAEGTYYWRVRSYDSYYGEYGEYPDTYNFLIVSTSSTTGTGVHGVVFEAESLGNSVPLPSALVTIYNDTYSDTAVTGPEGYYQFPVSNGTYIIYASLSGYDTSAQLPVNVTGNYTIMNIPLIQSESYFSPHYVRFIVTDSWYWERYVGATVTVYENEDTSVLFTETTGTDGAVGFELSENIEYRIVTTYGDVTQTDYITPTENTYYIVLEDIETSLLPDNQFYDIISINITKTEINSTNARINIVYNDSAEDTNSVYFVLGQSYENGTLNILETSSTYTGDCNVTFNITGYLGQSYIIKAVIDHGDFGEVTKYFSVDFPSNNLPFTGKGVVYLCILVLFVVAAQFGKADNTQGAILLCGLTWFMYAMDIFLTFGESVNTLIGVGLGISTAYALLAYINKKRNEEGI